MPEFKSQAKPEYFSPELMSFVVLAVLSALSGFWLIMYFIGLALALWCATSLLRRLFQYTVARRSISNFDAVVGRPDLGIPAKTLLAQFSRHDAAGVRASSMAETLQARISPDSVKGLD